MNFLAHSQFAQQNQELIVGQFCGDFVRGNNLDRFPEAVQQGILLHRQIDAYTDQHPVNLQARRLFHPPYRRFASILTDVVYDHYLALSWTRYNTIELEQHVELVHDALETHFELLPLRLQRFARLIIDENVLISYLRFDAVEQALTRLSWRSPRFRVLESAAAEVQNHNPQLRQYFDRFFPELIDHMDSVRIPGK